MPLPRLLIADSDTEFSSSLAQALGDRFTLRTCSTGTQAWELLQIFQPHILLTELMLPQLDGISLLHRLRQSGFSTKVLVLTGLRTSYTLQTLQQLQVDYLMLKPCDTQALCARLQDLSAGIQPAVLCPTEPKHLLGRILLSLGFSPTASGYRYLMMAIPLYAADPRQSITKELYAAVGAHFQKKPPLVERAIRAAIDSAWKNRDESLWRQYLPCSPDGHIPRPSNGDLIGALMQVLAERDAQPFGA